MGYTQKSIDTCYQSATNRQQPPVSSQQPATSMRVSMSFVSNQKTSMPELHTHDTDDITRTDDDTEARTDFFRKARKASPLQTPALAAPVFLAGPRPLGVLSRLGFVCWCWCDKPQTRPGATRNKAKIYESPEQPETTVTHNAKPQNESQVATRL